MNEAAGHYNQNHILLRKRWHAATSKLLGKNKIDEMCDFSANQIGKPKSCFNFMFICKLQTVTFSAIDTV